MMKRFTLGTALAVSALALSLSGCNGNGPQVLGAPNGGRPSGTYTQTELWGRPAVKEGLEMFKDHDATNRSEPFADPTLNNDIGSFVSTVAKRDATTTSTIQSILGLNEMMFDTSSAATKAAYLGVESKGATGSTFGGRALNDDVIDLDLNVVFGDTLSKLGLIPDDGNESPCLTTDNVGPSAKTVTSPTFPYVQPPV